MHAPLTLPILGRGSIGKYLGSKLLEGDEPEQDAGRPLWGGQGAAGRPARQLAWPSEEAAWAAFFKDVPSFLVNTGYLWLNVVRSRPAAPRPPTLAVHPLPATAVPPGGPSSPSPPASSTRASLALLDFACSALPDRGRAACLPAPQSKFVEERGAAGARDPVQVSLPPSALGLRETRERHGSLPRALVIAAAAGLAVAVAVAVWGYRGWRSK